MKIFLAKYYKEPYVLEDELMPGRDFATLCLRASGHHDALTNSKNGIKIKDSLGPMGHFMGQAAESAAKKMKKRK